MFRGSSFIMSLPSRQQHFVIIRVWERRRSRVSVSAAAGLDVHKKVHGTLGRAQSWSKKSISLQARSIFRRWGRQNAHRTVAKARCDMFDFKWKSKKTCTFGAAVVESALLTLFRTLVDVDVMRPSCHAGLHPLVTKRIGTAARSKAMSDVRMLLASGIAAGGC